MSHSFLNKLNTAQIHDASLTIFQWPRERVIIVSRLTRALWALICQFAIIIYFWLMPRVLLEERYTRAPWTESYFIISAPASRSLFLSFVEMFLFV